MMLFAKRSEARGAERVPTDNAHMYVIRLYCNSSILLYDKKSIIPELLST